MTRFKTTTNQVSALALSLVLGTALTPQSAHAQEFEWSMATPWSGGHWLEVGAKGFAELVREYTDGRVDITVYQADTVGSALKVTETVRNGVAEVGHNWPSYDYGVDKTGVIFGGWAGGLNPQEYMMWLYNAGGAELWREWRLETSDVVAIPCGVLETEVFLHSHKAVRTLEDYQGMKVRTSGAWAEIASELGASTVTMSGSEVFNALERKIVDGIEWGGPGINSTAGFDKVAEYIITPGIHAPGGAHECIFNRAAWDKLSDRDKRMIEAAGKQMVLNTFLAYAEDDLEGYEKLMEGGDNTLVELDSSFIEAAEDASNAWAEKQAAENDWFERAYKHQRDFEQDLQDWQKFRQPIGD